jgi:autotransporter translocation and assembly factor TamB
MVLERVTLAQEQRLTTRRLAAEGLAWENADPVTAVRSPQGRLDLQRFVLRNGRQEVSARGILMPDGGLEADVQVQHLLILPSMRMVVPNVSEVDGEVTLHLSLHGTLAQPQGEGELHITSLRWQQYQLGEVHSQVQANSTAVNVDLRWLDQK